jgi:hypothetical protein
VPLPPKEFGPLRGRDLALDQLTHEDVVAVADRRVTAKIS